MNKALPRNRTGVCSGSQMPARTPKAKSEWPLMLVRKSRFLAPYPAGGLSQNIEVRALRFHRFSKCSEVVQNYIQVWESMTTERGA